MKIFIKLMMALVLLPLAATNEINVAENKLEVIRIGDLLMLELPGESEFAQPFQVDRSGKIILPELGAVNVSGQTLQQADIFLRQLLSEKYKASEKLNLYIKEKRIPVTVLGYVKQPGKIDLPEEGNIQMALSYAGGAAAGAQLDKLQVRRDKQVIRFDYKQYLDTGDTELLPELKALDIIFVPASPLIGNVQMDFDAATLSAGGDASESNVAVKVFGEVNNPGSFSFKQGNSIVDMLMRAGGVTRYAGVEHIRIINFKKPELFDLKAYLDSGNTELMPELKAGATIFVPIQEDEVKSGARTIYVMGEVFKPGAYEAQSATGFFDILANAGGPTRFAESRQVRIIRTSGSVDNFDLQAFTEGLNQQNVPVINPGDAIFVPEKTDMNEKSWLKVSPNRAVKVIGAVNRTGRFEWSAEMSFLDILAHAGGPNSDADISQVKIVSKSKPLSPTIFNLEQFINQGGDFDLLPKIQAGDIIYLPERPRDVIDNKARWLKQPSEGSIYVFGMVGQPGRYAFKNEFSLLDILSAADGPTNDADIHHIRITHRNYHPAKVSVVDLGRYFETGDETLLPDVKAGDSIYVPTQKRPWLDVTKEETVRIIGAVDKPGRYHFNQTMTILDILAEAGGPTQNAYLNKIIVVNFHTDKGEQSVIFDLPAFVEKPVFSELPIVRAGDTIYVPDMSRSGWQIFMTGVKDVFSILSVMALTGGI